MRKTIAGILIGMFVGAVVEGQMFGSYWNTGQIFESGGALTEQNYFETLRLGYATGVADTIGFVVEFGRQSKLSYEQDYETMASIHECLSFRGTTRGTLTSYASDMWRKWKTEKESAAAVLAVSCLPDTK